MRSLRDRFRNSQPSTDDSPIAADAVSVWNTVYTLGIGSVGGVDDRGAIFPDRRKLSVEVWFGVGERWMRGGSADGVRQRRVNGLPIIETRQRVGESDLVQTTWADESGDGQGRINVQLANETGDAVIAAIVVRPLTRLGPGAIEKIRCVGELIVANGRPIVDIGRVPGDCATARDSSRDLTAVLHAVSLPTGDRADSWEIEDVHGTACLAAMIPLTPGVDRTLQILDGREEASVAPAPLDAVERGWGSHLAEGAEIELPSWPNHLFPSLRSSLLGAADDLRRPVGDRGWTLADDALIVSALGVLGLGEAGVATTARLLTELRAGSLPRDRWPDVAAAMAAIVGTADGDALLTHERETVATVVGYTLSLTHESDIAAPLIQAVAVSNGPDAANDAAQIQGKADAAVERALLQHGWLGASPLPAEAGPSPATSESIAIEMIASAHRGEPSEPLVHLRSKAGSSWRWGRDACGDSPHVRAQIVLGLASWCRRVRPTEPGGTIDLLTGMRPQWYGQSLSFSRMPTAGARLSCALRWHGARPALLWEFDGDMPAGFSVTCTQLDASFSSTDRSGEALLEAPPGAPR